MNDQYHGDENYQEASPLDDEILRMQEEINDLRWRMNALCTFLSLKYPDDMRI